MSKIKPRYYKKIFERISNYYQVNIPSEILELAANIKASETTQIHNKQSIGHEKFKQIIEINPQIFEIFVSVLSDYKRGLTTETLPQNNLFPKISFPI